MTYLRSTTGSRPTDSVRLYLACVSEGELRASLRGACGSTLTESITTAVNQLTLAEAINVYVARRLRRNRGLPMSGNLTVTETRAKVTTSLLIRNNYPHNLQAIRNGKRVVSGEVYKLTPQTEARLKLTHGVTADTAGFAIVKCKLCREEFYPSRSQVTYIASVISIPGKYANFYCSDTCRRTCSLTPLVPVDFSAGLLKLWAEEVKTRDGYMCQVCGSEDSPQAHHIKPKSTNPLMAYDLDNGITVCRDCHMRKFHVGNCSTKSLAERACKVKATRKKFIPLRQTYRWYVKNQNCAGCCLILPHNDTPYRTWLQSVVIPMFRNNKSKQPTSMRLIRLARRKHPAILKKYCSRLSISMDANEPSESLSVRLEIEEAEFLDTLGGNRSETVRQIIDEAILRSNYTQRPTHLTTPSHPTTITP